MLIPTRTQQGQRDEGKGGRREGKRRSELTNSSSSFKVGVVKVLGVSFDVLDGAYQEGSKVKVVVSKGDFRGKCRAQVKERRSSFPFPSLWFFHLPHHQRKNQGHRAS